MCLRCDHCKKELPDGPVFTVSWGEYCGPSCATDARHVALGEA